MGNNAAVLSKYFAELTSRQIEQFEMLWGLYHDWNAMINVISRKDVDELYVKHVLHSLSIARLISFKPGASILDVGTGGGFPGIPLAIMFPEVRFKLIDSIGKKVSVVKAVSEALTLQNASAEQVRAEHVKGRFDFVISRAVTRMKPFIAWIRKNVHAENSHDLKNGVLYLKGGDLDEELNEINRPYRIYELKTFFDEPFFETKKIVHVPLN